VLSREPTPGPASEKEKHMTTSSPALRTSVRAVVLLGSALLITVLGGSAANAAPPKGGPSGSASCVGQVFVPQATGAPQTVADRIHEIMEVELPKYDANFGQAISGLARDTWCRSG
jgi:hypothetical protein